MRRRLIDVARRLDNHELDAMTANSLVNTYRLILTTIVENDLDRRVKRIETALLKAQEYAS